MTKKTTTALKDLTLRECLQEAANWNRADIRGIDDITPNLPMLRARGRVIKAALTLVADPPRTVNLDGDFAQAIMAIRKAHDAIKKAKDSEDGGNDEEHDAAVILCDELNALYAVVGIKEI